MQCALVCIPDSPTYHNDSTTTNTLQMAYNLPTIRIIECQLGRTLEMRLWIHLQADPRNVLLTDLPAQNCVVLLYRRSCLSAYYRSTITGKQQKGTCRETRNHHRTVSGFPLAHSTRKLGTFTVQPVLVGFVDISNGIV